MKPSQCSVLLLAPESEIGNSLLDAWTLHGWSTTRVDPHREDLWMGYRQWAQTQRQSRLPGLVVAFGDSADRLARDYYSFFAIERPFACVLLSPTVGPLHLNNLTCPYLLLQGGKDPVFASRSPSDFDEAIHHHQMRYGDLTQCLRWDGLGRWLGGPPRLSPGVIQEMVIWMQRVMSDGGLRQQEPMEHHPAA